MSNPATGRNNSHDYLLDYRGATFREGTHFTFPPAFRLSELRCCPFDIIDRERIRAEQAIMADEDAAIFAAINSLTYSHG